MTVGLSVGFINSFLNTLNNVGLVIPIVCVQLHVGDPGVVGTSNVSAVTSRKAASFNTASGGAIALIGASPQWSMTTAETITHISTWSGFDGDGAAQFLWSAFLLPSRSVANGDTFNLNSCNLAVSTQAA